MKTFFKLLLTLLLIAAVLWFLASGILYLTGYTKTFEKQYTVDESFDSVVISCESSKVNIVPSEDGKCFVEATESKGIGMTVEVKNGELQITQHSSKWYLHVFSFGFGKYSLTVHIPAERYDKVKIKTVSGSIKCDIPLNCDSVDFNTTSGSVTASGISCRELETACVSGSIKLTDVRCETANLRSTSGSVDLKDLIANRTVDINVTSGSISFDSIDAAELRLETVSGSIKGSLLTGKTFKAETVSGSVSVPEDSGAGTCRAKTTSGSIKITVK
jgi:DUF4097 and DUF4098 domain-containing protein YvlB